MYNYSIIIPFRNNVELLSKATQSIPDRNDIQIIIVDNSPTSFKDKYVVRHKNAKTTYLTSNSNGGAGCARNVGLQHAEGKKLLFLDADDYFTPQAFGAFDKYLDTKYDLVFFDVQAVKLTDGSISKRGHSYNVKIRENNERLLRYRAATPYCKLVDSSLIKQHNIKFDEVRVSNDMMFSVKVGHYAKSVAIDHEVCYTITEGETGGSLTKTNNPDNLFVRFSVAIERNKFFTQVGCDDVRFPLLPYIAESLYRFGPFTFVKFLRKAFNERQNIFNGVRDVK